MRIFKFGGASVKDAEGVRNVYEVLRQCGESNTVVVVSAMGKTTNALERIVQFHLEGSLQWKAVLEEIRAQHYGIMEELFLQKEHTVYQEIEHVLAQIRLICQTPPTSEYNMHYDRIVSYGEIMGTRIVSAFLNDSGLKNTWLDARKLIKTDSNHRFARINWSFTEILVQQSIRAGQSYVIQGFIGSDDNLHATTLGREGSDYTASILAYVLNAKEVCIWKDVPGVLNGDPKVFPNVKLINHISYREAIELAYFGASVIHPKTIQPLQRKNIPLYVKSFLNPLQPGTRISEGADLEPELPIFIRKTDQAIIKLSTRDLAFIVEENLSAIYNIFHRFGVRVNLMQNSAVSSSFCINNDPISTVKALDELKHQFDVDYTSGVTLFTIRHDNGDEARAYLNLSGDIKMEQRTPSTIQIAVSME